MYLRFCQVWRGCGPAPCGTEPKRNREDISPGGLLSVTELYCTWTYLPSFSIPLAHRWPTRKFLRSFLSNVPFPAYRPTNHGHQASPRALTAGPSPSAEGSLASLVFRELASALLPVSRRGVGETRVCLVWNGVGV